MKVLGISIEGNKAIFSGLELNQNGEIVDISNNFRKLELKDHFDSNEVRSFMEVLHSFLDSIKFDEIGIIKRGTKGNFAASPISFKIEGLIQSYADGNIIFISPLTLKAFFKKNSNSVSPKYSYQINANDLAFYLLNK